MFSRACPNGYFWSNSLSLKCHSKRLMSVNVVNVICDVKIHIIWAILIWSWISVKTSVAYLDLSEGFFVISEGKLSPKPSTEYVIENHPFLTTENLLRNSWFVYIHDPKVDWSKWLKSFFVCKQLWDIQQTKSDI